MATALLQEFKLLEEDASVFKLVGPVLVKQDLQEARANIQKRMEFIKIEMCTASESFLRACMCAQGVTDRAVARSHSTRLDNQFKEKEKLVKSRRDTVAPLPPPQYTHARRHIHSFCFCSCDHA